MIIYRGARYRVAKPSLKDELWLNNYLKERIDAVQKVDRYIESAVNRFPARAKLIRNMAAQFPKQWVGNNWERYSDAYGTIGTEFIELAEDLRQAFRVVDGIRKALPAVERYYPNMDEDEQKLYEQLIEMTNADKVVI